MVDWDDPSALAALSESALQNTVKDMRFYDLSTRTLPHSGCGHLLLEDAGGAAVAQPFFLYDLDVTMAAARPIRGVVGLARHLSPHWLTTRALVVGCIAGTGTLAAPEPTQQHWQAETLAAALPGVARELGAQLVLLKEFPARDRDVLRSFTRAGFSRIPSLPHARLSLAYGSIDEYLATLGRSTRRSLRRNLRASRLRRGLTLEVRTDVAGDVDELYRLYANVAGRSRLGFERLTPEFLAELGRVMPDRVRFFVWRLDGRPVAFSLCLADGDTLHDEYLGLDYTVSLDLHLWFVTFCDLVEWAIEQGFRWYATTAGAYEPKRRLRCTLAPLDLYVRHTSAPANAVLHAVRGLLDPCRHDEHLRRFADYETLH